MRRWQDEPAKVFKPQKSKYWTISNQNLKTWLSVFLIIGLFIGFFLFIRSSFFAIKKVNCLEYNFVCEQTKQAVVNTAKGENLFFVNTNDLSRQIKKTFPQIKEVKWVKKLPSTLEAHLQLRQPGFLATNDQENWYLADESGLVLGRAQELVGLPKIIFSDYYNLEAGVSLDSSFSKNALLLAKTLRLFFVDFDQIKVNYPEFYQVKLKKNEAIFSPDKPIKPQVASLQLILSRSRIEGKIPKKIDLRFEKPVVTF